MNKKNGIVFIIAGVVVVFVLAGAFVLNSGKTQGNVSVESGETSVSLLSPEEFRVLAAKEDLFVLDVHTPRQTHIPGTDAFIPYDNLSGYISELPQDKTTPILVYCRSGSMSKSASDELVTMGYTRVFDLAGGTDAYKRTVQDVSVTPFTIGLGTVIYGDVPTTEFTLTNYTPEMLTVTRVSTSCGCTTATMDQKSLEPFSTAVVHVAFNPAVHGDDTDLGQLTRTIYIDTDNPDFPQVTASITANVVKE